MEDCEIIEHLWQRLENAIAEVKEKYHRLCIKVSNSITMNHRDAEECVNDSYLKLWSAIPPNRPHSLKAFLLRIVKNTAIDRLRKNKSTMKGCELTLVYEELSECLADESGIGISEELKEIMNGFLKKLDTDNRRVFMKRYWYTLSISEIAEEEGIKESTIKMRLLRLRDKLKRELEKEGFHYDW
jgi:RNA polymerase sigma factor (sigma-70 family)